MCVAAELLDHHFVNSPVHYMGTPLMTIAAETAIYQTTQQRPGGYSFPSGIITAARQMGLTAEVYAQPSKGLRLMARSNLIQNEVNWCTQNQVPVHRTKAPATPPPNHRHLKCIAWFQILGLHWVVVRNDGTVMDPATGLNWPGLDAFKRGAVGPSWGGKHAHGTGLTIDLS